MSFLDIALRNVARGYTVLPVTSADGKACYLKDWPNLATTDRAKIEEWAQQYPEANCAVAVSDELMVLESDNYPELVKLIGAPVPNTWTVQCRENRPHFYFWQTDKSRKMGNNDLKNVFEFKQWHRYVIAEGSVRRQDPDAGLMYKVIDSSPIIPIPDWIVDRLPVKVRPDPAKPGEKIKKGEGQHEGLTRRAGSLRNTGLDYDGMLAALLALNDLICDPPLPLEDVEHIAHSSVTLWKVPEPEPGLLFAKPSAQVITAESDIEECTDEDSILALPLPFYPYAVWLGTVYYDFAKAASADNFVSVAFFIEGAMTYAGAVLYNQLACYADEVTPRLFTVLLAPPGVGKGTTYRRIHQLFEAFRLLDALKKDEPPRPCSALLARPASENGLNESLLSHPCVISDFEEMDKLFEKTRVENSGGSLMSTIRTLFDDTRTGISTCKGRPEAATLGYFSLLGAMTPSLWKQALEGKDSYGSGLGGRLNILATNDKRATAMLTPVDFSPYRKALEKKFSALDGSCQSIGVDRDARALLVDWWADKYSNPYCNRVNVITGRKALHMAWVTGHPTITREIMEKCIQLGDYLIAVREAYAVTKGEDKSAIGENRVLQILESMKPKAMTLKQIVLLLDGLMSRTGVYRALESLANSREVEKLTVKKDGKKPYVVYRKAGTFQG